MDLGSVYIPTLLSRDMKAVCTARDVLIRSRTLLVNSVRAWIRLGSSATSGRADVSTTALGAFPAERPRIQTRSAVAQAVHHEFRWSCRAALPLLALATSLFVIGCQRKSASGESCTRTDDCETPLRCSNLVCVEVERAQEARSPERASPAAGPSATATPRAPAAALKMPILEYVTKPFPFGRDELTPGVAAKVLKHLGNPKNSSRRTVVLPNAVGKTWITTFTYEGLEVEVIRFSDDRERISFVKVTSPEVETNRPLRVGMKRSDVIAILGPPSSEESGVLTYCDESDIVSQCADIGLRDDVIIFLSWAAAFD